MRERNAPRLAACLALACAAGLGRPLPAAAEFGDPIHGQALFVDKGCVECHSVRGAGGRIGPDLGRAAVKGSFFEIATGMWNHSPVMGQKMEEFRVTRPSFQDDQLADLLAFLYFLNYFDEPGDARVGKVLYAEKHCIQCHGLGREGGLMGPRLDAMPRGTSPLRIAQDLWNHGARMIPTIRKMGLDLPEFQGSEILDLLAYLRSQGQRQAARDFRSAGDPRRGERLFAAKGCSRCHPVLGKDPGIGPDLGKAELRGSVTQLAGRMWNHWPVMSEAMEAQGMSPPTFAGEELADVFAYLFITRYEGARGDVPRGAVLYQQKGCAMCHGQEGQGGIGPALRQTTHGESKERIVQRMWNHGPQMWAKMGERQMSWPRFEADELAALVAFLSGGWKDADASSAAAGR